MKLFSCPLECGEKIKDFYRHKQKCKRKNLLGTDYKKCEYDYNHILKVDQYEQHLKDCDSSKIFW
jgi:hypothetical protein